MSRTRADQAPMLVVESTTRTGHGLQTGDTGSPTIGVRRDDLIPSVVSGHPGLQGSVVLDASLARRVVSTSSTFLRGLPGVLWIGERTSAWVAACKGFHIAGSR